MIGAMTIDLVAVGSDPMGQVIATAGAQSREAADALHREGHGLRPYSTVRRGDVVTVRVFEEVLARAVALGGGSLGTLQRVGPLVTPEQLVHDGGDTARLVTISPVQFRAGRLHGQSTGARLDALFPDPVRIVTDAEAKWQELGWPELPSPNTNRLAGWVDRCEVGVYHAGRHVFRGWMGAVVVDVRALSPQDRVTVWALLRFAALRGVGAHTTYGMGAIDIE